MDAGSKRKVGEAHDSGDDSPLGKAQSEIFRDAKTQ